MTGDDFRFACVYNVFHSKHVDFDGDLRELVEQHVRNMEQGAEAVDGYYERVNGEWVERDVTATEDEIKAEDQADMEAIYQLMDAQPFGLHVHGPDSIETLWSRHVTKADAETAGRALPEGLGWHVGPQ